MAEDRNLESPEAPKKKKRRPAEGEQAAVRRTKKSAAQENGGEQASVRRAKQSTDQMTGDESAAKEREARKRARQKRERERQAQQRKMILTGIIVISLIVLLVVMFLLVRSFRKAGKSQTGTSSGTAVQQTQGVTAVDPAGTSGSAESTAQGTQAQPETQPEAAPVSADAVLAASDRMAAMYDYDAAIAYVQSQPGYESNADYMAAIQRYTDTKATCIPYDVEEIPHVFYHSLLNDSRGFDPAISGDFVANDNNAWMCSVNEFNTITQQMYDYGCVLVSMHDLVTEYRDENGEVHFEKNTNLMLPPGKHPVIMSEDDLSYYHAYENQGIASKLVLDENGKVKCEYINENGETLVGDYDVVPLLSSFIDAHPDFSYHNRHCMIALTGYNGVFGYRTDTVYLTRDPEHLDANQAIWLEQHPEFDFDQDVAEAKVIADALKAEGYEFASHTWGHRRVNTASVEALKEDNEKWVNTVAPIVGEIDSIIFAHGTDLCGPEDYSYDNEKFAYFKSVGYNYYANVDGSVPVWNQLRDNYVRTGRIDIDGYRLYQAMTGVQSAMADFEQIGVHDIESFFDQSRITPVVIPQ